MSAVVIAISTWIGFWSYNNFQWVNEKIHIGYQGEAKTNSLLAAQRLIIALGGKAQSMHGIPKNSPQGVTLVMPTLRYTLSPQASQELLSWVAAGNHLVVVANSKYYTGDKKDVLLDILGISEVNIEIEDDDQKDATTEDYKPLRIDISGHGDFLQINFGAWHRLTSKQTPLWQIADSTGAYIVQVKHGNGKVTVMTDNDFMKTPGIGKYDHAALTARVLEVRPGNAVWLIYSEDMPPFLEWLTLHAWQVLISGALLLIMWLWAASRRFGVPLPELGMARRSLLEHITAAGYFLWQYGGESALLARMRTSVKQAIFLRYPRWANMSDEQLYHELATLSGLSIQQIEKALDLPVYGNQHEFTHVIQTMETIRRKL